MCVRIYEVCVCACLLSQETDEEFTKFSKHLSEITPLLQTASQVG